MSAYAPWYVIVWRSLWVIPARIVWALLVALSFIGWGKGHAKRVMNI